MRLRSPSASSIAPPSTRPRSSTVWCWSTSRSPFAFTVRSKRPCTATSSSMWSRNGRPVLTAAFPEPSSTKRTWMSVSFVRRACRPRRAAGIRPVLPLTLRDSSCPRAALSRRPRARGREKSRGPIDKDARRRLFQAGGDVPKQRSAVGDEHREGAGAVLGLSKEVERQDARVGVGGRYGDELARSLERVDTYIGGNEP